MGRFWLGLAVVAACSPDTPATVDAPPAPPDSLAFDPNDGARSGTRLKLVWYEFTDGTRQWNGMYDSQRKEYCSPYYSAWSDGNVYCTPEHGGSLVYTNAACTAKAMMVYVDTICPQPAPKYLLEYASGTCTSSPAHLWIRGTKITPATYYTKSSTGACTATTSPSYESFYAVSAEVATTDLVKLTLETAPTGPRLGVRAYSSPDGMRFPWLLHDTSIDVDCYPSYYSDIATTATCAPADANYAGYDHDAGCVQPEMSITKTCAVPKYAYTFPDTSCPSDEATYYTVGAQLPATPLYYSTGTACTSTTPDATQSYYSLGQRLVPAAMTRSPDMDPLHRIQLVHYADADGLVFRDKYAVYDSQKQTSCYPETLPDGTIRCVAYGGYVDTYYTSSACTTPVDVVEIYTGPTGCTAPTLPKFARKYISPMPGTCTYDIEVHPITSLHTAAVYTGSPGACSVYTPYEGKLYNVGAAVPITDFVGAALVTDP